LLGGGVVVGSNGAKSAAGNYVGPNEEETMKSLLPRPAVVGALLCALLCGTPSFVYAAGSGWFTTWAGPGRDPGATASNFPAGTTVREPVFASISGDSVRVKFSNAFGTATLTIGPASIGTRLSGSSVIPGTLMALTFGGQSSIDIPPHGLVLSDPVSLTVPALTDVVVSIYLPNGSGESVMYPGANKTTYVGAGDQTQNNNFVQASTSGNGFFLASVEVHSTSGVGMVAAVGDSITQGVGSTGENNRWSDRLAVRVETATASPLGVIGLGIAGNQMLGNPAALARFDRDVLGMAGLTHVIMADGINDFGSTVNNPSSPPDPEDVEYGLRQLVSRAHARGVKVIGTTMGPAFGFRGYEAIDFKRLAYNQWIRTVGMTILDGLIDFDTVLNDPNNPSHMLPQYLTDGIHPNNAGHQAMADAVNLNLFH
jgi:lysophospholipase L1-like esterase